MITDVVMIIGVPIVGLILVSGFAFARYLVTGRYWLDKRTGLFRNDG